ncbi:hypothetical protein [Aquimarina sp. SS2-1]|uniref:hypothetical protein n=1 Tax=Aquimarina besae TaxID=3342247 RepID=UPI00366CD1A0
MKSLFCFVVGILCMSAISAQSIYEAGYFIDNNGKKTECLIKKLPWRTNPTEFQWKKTISSSPKTEVIEDIKEFAVGEDYRYKRYILQFDLNGDTVGKSTKSKDPDLTYKKIFLRTILKSKTTLFQYSKDDVHRFFYTNPETVYPELLVYKVFYTPDESKKPGKKVIPQENNTYQQQLAEKIKCGKQDPSKLTYTQGDLKRYFKKYNECKGNKIDYIIRKKINQTRIGIVAAADLTGFTHNSIIGSAGNVNYDDVFVPRYGIFVETFIPFSKVDLSFFLESTYKAFSTEGSDLAIANSEFKLDYKSINVAVGPRFHIYLSSKFELFLEGGLTVDFNLGTESNVFAENEIENTTTDYFYGGGFGSGRFKIGFRQYTPKNISKSTLIPDSELTTSSLYVSFNIF